MRDTPPPTTSDEHWTVEDEIEAALKPCPRCGSKAVLDDGHGNGIHCDGCGYWTGEDMDREDAIEWWNMQPYIERLLSRIDLLMNENRLLRQHIMAMEEQEDDE